LIILAEIILADPG